MLTGEPPAKAKVTEKPLDWLRSCTGNDGLTPYGVGPMAKLIEPSLEKLA
jgi:hypothetical protein